MEITKNSLDYLNITSLSKTYYQILKFREPLKVIFTGKHCVCVCVCVCVCICVILKPFLYHQWIFLFEVGITFCSQDI